MKLYVTASEPLQPGGSIGDAVTGGTIYFTKARYTWNFGDPGTSDNVQLTSDPGGPYPTGQVFHVYQHAKDYTVTLTVEWFVTYDYTLNGVTVTGQVFGWIPQPGAPQTFQAHIVEAHAVLTN